MRYITMSTQLPPFLPYPKFLLELPLSETARLVYVLILSRVQLSLANGWTDEQGWVYCRYPVLSLAEDCRRSKSAITVALRELEQEGLLFRRRGGAGYANMLFPRLPEICTSEEQDSGLHRTGTQALREADFHPSEEPKTTLQRSRKQPPNKITSKTTRINGMKNYDYKGDSL